MKIKKHLRFILSTLFMLMITAVFAVDMTVELKDSDGAHLEGGMLKYYDSGWKTASEGADGVFTFSTSQSNISLKMYYAGGSQQASNVPTSSSYIFNTIKVTTSLVDSDGSPLSGGLVKYYASGWKTFGTTDGSGTVTKELLPVKYSFKMYYLGGSQQISNHDTGADATVEFQTTEVTVELKSSTNAPLENGMVKYYASGWKTFGTTDASGKVTKELLPIKYSFKMYYLGGSQQISNQDVGSNPLVSFQTTLVTVKLISSLNAPLEDGKVKYYASGWKDFGTTDATGMVTKELLPIKYSFKMYYMGGSQQISNHDVGANPMVTFQTTLVTVELKNCDGTGIDGGMTKYYASGWKTFGTTDATGIATKELLPVKYSFKMYLHGKTQQISNQDVGANPTVSYQTVSVTLNYGETIKFYASGWKTFTQPYMEMLPGTYSFKFGSLRQQIVLSGCEYGGNVFIFYTKKSDGSPLPGIKISRNDYGNHYVTVGYTDANGYLFTTSEPAGTWKFGANKDKTNQYYTTGPGAITFQTAKFVVNIKKSDCVTNFEGIKVSYNDYGNHYLSMGTTDANGLASIELFPGNYKFKGYKDHTEKTDFLELTSPGSTGTVIINTANFMVHVKHHDGSDYEDIAVSFNDYGNHYLSMGKTDANGYASIELFPGNRKFKAYKDHTFNTAFLEISSSCNSDIVEFKTAQITSLAEDCDEGTPIPGIKMYFNDYGNHWLSMGTTDASGETNFELFPGNGYKFKGRTIYTEKISTLDLLATGLDILYNPIRLDFNYPGIVKYNDYGSHWMTIPDDTYIFPGVYDFKFAGVQRTIDLSALCSIEGIAFVHAEYSDGSPMVGKDVYYYYYPGPTVHAGQTNANGNKIIFFTEPVSNVKVTFEHYDYNQSKTQNVHSDAIYNFNTVAVTMQLQDHDGDGTTDDLTGNEANNLKIYKYPTTKTFASGTTSGYTETMELLPLTYDFYMTYEGVVKKINQNVATNSTVLYQTTEVTLNLIDHTGGTALLDDNGMELKYYKYPYTGDFGDGEAAFSESMDLFPATYDFYMKYMGINKKINQNVAVDNTVDFQTVDVTVSLIDHAGGTSLLTGDATTLKYYKYPHTGTFGDGDLLAADSYKETMELFPFTYDFYLTYAGGTQKITQDISAPNNTVLYQTGRVEDVSVAPDYCTKYYKYPTTSTFVNNMELLPLTFKFYFDIGSSVTFTVPKGQTLEIPTGTVKQGIVRNDPRFKPFDFNVYPSPFKERTTLAFNLSREESVKVLIFDMKGNLVQILQNGTLPAGDHHLTWDGRNIGGQEVGRGVYIIKLLSNDRVGQRQLIKQ